METKLVTYDGVGIWQAIDNTGYWNGFLCPVFTETVANEISAYVIARVDKRDYETEKDYLDDVTPQFFETRDGVDTYTLGAFGWAWQEWDKSWNETEWSVN